jgi:hypothetical protein
VIAETLQEKTAASAEIRRLQRYVVTLPGIEPGIQP